MNALLGFHEACERKVRYFSLDNQRHPAPILDIGRLAIPSDRAEGISLAKEKIAKLRFANTRGTP